MKKGSFRQLKGFELRKGETLFLDAGGYDFTVKVLGVYEDEDDNIEAASIAVTLVKKSGIAPELISPSTVRLDRP
ncbi:MAG: hypothetical protein Q8P23_00930 [bacterium]|nr:hypothetical protein [bacterium]